ncbi:MAG: DUF1553 domain-containing protein, partial [Planctomycetes bacterium]|nr:DUF1553 domain-containing protein [Planctomycetota bacterium]
LTIRRSTCHSHKYDPISQKEYYRFYAYFNQTADNDQPNESPVIPAPRRQDLLAVKRIEGRIAALRKHLAKSTPQLAAEQSAWETKFRQTKEKQLTARFVRIEIPGRGKLLSLAEVQVFSQGKNVARTGQAKQSSTDYNGPARLAVDGNTNGDFAKAKSTTHTRTQNDPWWEVDLGKELPLERVVVWNRTDNRLQRRLSNYRVLLFDAKHRSLWQRDVKSFPNPSSVFTPGGVRSTVPADLLAIIDTPHAKRSKSQRDRLTKFFRTIAPSLKTMRTEIARLEKSRPKFPTVPVMQELPVGKRRKSYLMIKGNFLTKGEAVQPGVPAAFHPLRKNAPANRLAVADWLIDRDNPLTARVAVNRFWSRIFGIGLVETEEDFGTQGELPTHPELLDWMAMEFMGKGRASGVSPLIIQTEIQRQKNQRADIHRAPLSWDMKRFLRLIVTSAAYRQSSRVTIEKLQRDPRNRLLSRAPRIRLEAEMIRDQALALSGLLSRKMMGKSVYPPQPPGLWRAAFNGQRKWPTSQGEDRYRRGLYTFWRRTVPYPSMTTFDAPSRELCTVRRFRTNTPLQALVTLNDPVYIEAAQALARRILREGGETTDARIRFALSLCLVRPPSSAQVRALTGLFNSERDHYRKHADAARKLTAKPQAGPKLASLAAWTVVANVLLNLDAVLTRN